MVASFLKRLVMGSAVILAYALSPGTARAEHDQKLIDRGAYLARSGDCMACHTNPGHPSYGGGYKITSPFGDIIVPNISSSKRYGIGNWTEKQFDRALRQGIAPRGYLYPAMPYTQYAHLSDADTHALYVYFSQAVEPVEYPPVDKTHLPFPFNIRQLMFGWNLLFTDRKVIPTGEDKPGSVERGRYLVRALAHCSACHTPRNIFMAEKTGKPLAGGRVGGWIAPNITSDPVSGIGGWTEEEIITYLRQGAVEGKAQAAGSMAEAVQHSFRFMQKSDLRAIARYLKTVPPVRDPGQKKPDYAFQNPRRVDIGILDRAENRSPGSMENGKIVIGERLYVGACAACHQLQGQGTEDQFYPSLTSNSATGSPYPNNLVLAILKGVHRRTNTGMVFMPAFEDQLDDAQIAAVADYVLEHFGNPSARVTPADVKRLRHADVGFWTVRLISNIILGTFIIVGLVILVLLISLFRRRQRRQR